jgi:hypothetical protein
LYEIKTVATFELQPNPAFDTAPAITLVEDEVVIVGPGALAFSMTRSAAEETHRRLGEVLFGNHNDDSPTNEARA